MEYALRECDGWQLTDAILDALTPALDCLFLCTPNNPTGLLPERGLLEAIARRCQALNISLILDEAFLDFIPDQPGFIPLLAQYPHVWVLRSLTKFYAIPGLRLGYLLNADAQAVARLRERQMPWSINAYAALAGEIILQDRAYQRATWQWLQEEGARFYAQLQEIAGLTVWPGRANYLFLRCDRPELDLQYALLRQHVLIRSCANYPGLDSRYFRVAIRSAGENDQLLAALRRALANMASHQGHDRCVDMGTISVDGEQLEAAHQALREAVAACQRAGKRTLVLGGGHETAFGHGAGVLDAFPGEKVGIINLDAHLDLRFAECASSGTPFRQLALECDAQQRGFHYTCIGVSRAANTQALWDEAARRQVAVVEDLAVLADFDTHVLPELERNIAQYDRLYLTIDLDVLPAREMPAVSAPAALGVPLAILLRIVELLCRSGKLQAVDLVEFNPQFDIDGQGARAAARLAWQIAHWWR
ncbi:hypothetical protein CWN73_12775 [Klebsiella quasipneumoniae]|nr:hypothetical protein CWN73_12775 [Klebsiella quasipneumoniae]